MSLEIVSQEYEMFSFWGYMKLIKYEYKSRQEGACTGFSKDLFLEMKKIGFSNHIIETKVDYDKWEEIPYGNYNLKKIQLTDFIEIPFNEIKASISAYLISEVSNEALQNDQRALLVRVFNNKFYQLIPEESICVKFKPNLSSVNKKLSWGGQFIHFQSYIFVSPNCKEVFYLEFGYD